MFLKAQLHQPVFSFAKILIPRFLIDERPLAGAGAGRRFFGYRGYNTVFYSVLPAPAHPIFGIVRNQMLADKIVEELPRELFVLSVTIKLPLYRLLLRVCHFPFLNLL